jgi:glycerophosphoryl diester phosphodiesterase
LWIAHRGESFDAPENTLAAVRLAWERGVDAVEIDVHLSRDGHPVVIHDADTLRIAGVKLVVADTTLDKLRALDVGRWKSPQYAGEHVPTLEEVLTTVPSDKRLFIEIKVGPESIPALADAIARSRVRAEQLVIISFDAETVRAAHERLPRIERRHLVEFEQDENARMWRPSIDRLIADAKAGHADGLGVSAEGPVDREFVAQLSDSGLSCHVWTVDDPDAARRFIDAGMDGITSNRAAWLSAQV